MSHRGDYRHGQNQRNDERALARYDSRPRYRERSSRASDYITRPSRPEPDPIAIFVQPDHATYKIRLDHGDSGYGGSDSDYMNVPVDTKDDLISPHAHDQGFVTTRKSEHRTREAQRTSNRQPDDASRAEAKHSRQRKERISRQEERPSSYDESDHYIGFSQPISSSRNRPTQERRSTDSSVPYEGPSDHRIYTDGWGSKHEFMQSHGIKPGEPGSYEEAGELLDKYREFDARYAREQAELRDRQPDDGFVSRTTHRAQTLHQEPDCEDKSNYRIVKDGWGDKHTFMRSHGLKPGDPDDYQEATDLLDRYRDLDSQHARDNHKETRSYDKISRRKKHSSRNYEPPQRHAPPPVYENESDMSYQSGESYTHSARGFSVPDSDFSSFPPPPPPPPPMPYASRRSQSYTAATTNSHADFSSSPSVHQPMRAYSPPRRAHEFNAAHAGFAYTRAIRQRRSTSSLRSPRHPETVHSGFVNTPPVHRPYSYEGSDTASLRAGSDDEFDGDGGFRGGSGFVSADSGIASRRGSGSDYYYGSEGSRSDVIRGGGSDVVYGSEYMSDTAVEHDDYDDEYDSDYDD
ncbi:hypothetical protein NX059_009049 [Plenodomus lindquistii]|nr:hypothetical protein NX059_009049 [Plenodomus lindquistii]